MRTEGKGCKHSKGRFRVKAAPPCCKLCCYMFEYGKAYINSSLSPPKFRNKKKGFGVFISPMNNQRGSQQSQQRLLKVKHVKKKPPS